MAGSGSNDEYQSLMDTGAFQQPSQQFQYQARSGTTPDSASGVGSMMQRPGTAGDEHKVAQDGDPNGTGDNKPSTADGSQQKFSRTKGACQQCRAVKQRCSGGSKYPCDRCLLYKLDCVFSKDPPPSSSQPRQPKKTAPKQTSSDPETSAAVLQSLQIITERLRLIETSIAAQNRTLPSSMTDLHQGVGFDRDVRIPTHETVSGEAGDPVSMVTSAIRGLDSVINGGGLASAASPSYSGASEASSPSNAQPRLPYEPDVPDAVSRGFLTVEEAQQLFDFYFARCVRWTPSLDALHDRNMHHVRRRSTFLFHAILSVASYFCYVPQGENGLRKYYAIVTTLVESLAPIVVSPNPAELTADLLMGILVCIMWKPVRCGSQMQLGPAGFAQLQSQSKLNPSSGYVLGGLALRISQLLGLAYKAAHLSPNNKASIDACRLWLWINLVDSQGALAEGKCPALEPSDALRITRLFASIKAKPTDVRLAAMVELYAAVVPIVALHHGAAKTDFRALYRANGVLDRLLVYWTPLIEEAHLMGDPLAYTYLNLFVPFVRVVLNADVFRTWLLRRKVELKGQPENLETTRFTLTSEEAHCIGFAVSAAEEMLYALSTASKTDRAQRLTNWAAREPHTGHRPALQLDADVARQLSSSIDSVLLVNYAFPPLFLAKLRASNIINCDLDMAPEITNDLYSVGFPSRSLLPASKFMRLLELSAEFYEVSSPNTDFPAIPQAHLLRTMACLSVPLGAPGSQPNYEFGNGRMDSACLIPGALNNPVQMSEFGPSAQAKAHAQSMAQVAANIAPTNANLPYPYNTMVFSTEGAERLDAIMQSAVPDPTSSASLLGSFAKIDADWNAYFQNTGVMPDIFDSTRHGAKGMMSVDIQNGSSLAGLANGKLVAPSPDAHQTLMPGSAFTRRHDSTSPVTFYPTPSHMSASPHARQQYS